MGRKKLVLSILMVAGLALISTAAWASTSPVIFYSDLTSGPNTGGQNNNGVFVTVWGNNFGSSQGSSYVTVGGGQVNNYPTWTNTEVTFQLGSLAASGNIVITTSAGSASSASGPSPFSFTVRSGNIYFVNPAAGTNGTGTYASPFNHLWYAYNVLNAGDTVYVESGTINDEVDGCTGWHSVLCAEKSGTQASPMSWIAYPNDKVTLEANDGSDSFSDGKGSDGDTISYVFRSNGASWWTVSKFTLFSLSSSAGGSNPVVSGSTGWVVVGNNYQTTNQLYNGSIEISGNNIRVLGNTDTGSYCSTYNNESHSVYVNGPSNPFEVAWNTFIGDYNMGWMIDSYHNGPRIGTMHDNLIIDSSTSGHAKGMLVDGCADLPTPDTQSTLYTNVTKAYNNVIINAGIQFGGGAIQANCGTNYIYNNTIYGNGAETAGVVQFEEGYGPGGGDPVNYFANNIIYSLTSGEPYLSNGGPGAAPNWSDFALLTNNNYYGEGNGPSEDIHPINANPQYVSPTLTTSANLQLQATSPDINAGYNTTAIVAADFNGLVRGSTPSIGAYEYAGNASSSPVVTITSPASGSSYTAGSNVTVTTTASETNGTITNISLYNGSGILLGSSSASPYSFVDTNMAAGGYSFYAVAKDANGVSTTSSAITVTITAASSSPVVSIASPANGSTYTQGSIFTITANASETGGSIAQVQYYSGIYLLATATASPYTASWTSASTGTFTLNAVATDVKGVSTTSSPITITVTTAAQGVAPSITAQPVSETVTAPATATFNVAATGTPAPTYQWMQSVNGGAFTSISGATGTSYTTAATTTANSGTKFECVVTNASGSVTSNAATLTVIASGVPVVSIASPANGSTYTQGSIFTITANASETGGTIAKVQYYSGTYLLATATTSPYTASWPSASTGTFTLNAMATDAKGVTTTSSPITITVT